MTSFNNIAIMGGYVARDPELRKVQGAKGEMGVLDLTLAINPETDKENVKADFIKVTMFGALAENTAKYVTKGSGIGVVGRLSTGAPYKDKNGVTQYPVNVFAENVDFSRDLSVNVNEQTLVGHLTKDPELAYTRTNMPVSRFVIGVTRVARKGEEAKSDFFQIITYGKQAEFVSKYFKKGMRVYVNGRVHTGSYENKDGHVVYTTEVVANRVKFAKKKTMDAQPPAPTVDDVKTEEYNQSTPDYTQQNYAVPDFEPSVQDLDQYEPIGDEFDDSLPF